MHRGMVHIKRFSAGSVAVAMALTALFVGIAIYGKKDLREFESATEQYLLCEKSAESLQKGSDTLTEQVRMYVITGRREYMDGYFQEANVTRRRENAVEDLNRYFGDTRPLEELQQALRESETLMQREYYAMHLTAAAHGAEDSTLPEEVGSVSLSAEDAALSTQQMLTKATELVFDDAYQTAKGRIMSNVESCVEDLVALTQQRQQSASSAFDRLFKKQELGLAVLVACLVGSSLVVHRAIVKPLEQYNESVRRDEPVPVTGAAELRSLAVTYNKVLLENRKTHTAILRRAEHDALSGLLNKGAFDKDLEHFAELGAPFALLLADIDRFKFFNDTYGHAVGDDIIRSVAGHLKSVFRGGERIYRAGGDEFAVILENATQGDLHMIADRLNTLRSGMMSGADGLPMVTMSVGVAFSEDVGAGESIFRCADEAMYYVKNHGRDGHRVFRSPAGEGEERKANRE